MKKRFFLFLTVWAFALYGFSQGTLEFNQVLLLENQQNSTSCTSCWTVPAGKVWKVEAASSNSSSFVNIYINNRSLSYLTGTSFSNSSTSYGYALYREIDFPFWMPAGSSLGFANLDQSSRSITFSVIEFNIIP